MPPPGTGVLSFGLVAIPVRIHTATKSENVSFHLLHNKCGSRVRNQHYCPACKVVVERADLVRGFQHAKDQYVPITEEELESLEAEANRSIDLKEFIPLASGDPVYFENTHYLGADKGGEKPYRLLADAMAKSGRVAIAELVSRGKEQLVLIRPYGKGLVLHTMYHADEVRDFKQVPKGENVKVSDEELELGVGLIDPADVGRIPPGELSRRVPNPHTGNARGEEQRQRAKAKSKGKEQRQRDNHCSAGAAASQQSRRHYGSAQAQHGENSGQKETGNSP
jgi:DNA end-binding protein Ku